ncbi:type IV secretion protein [Parashewanella spongiae]|uniref:Type IV secretion protein n=1 Tax=Parashewanella spongiae TaxID=342950 RepID=A0A3A6U700_9GAMM|nr:TrbC/VirB2 family protein [Parashewanella spongiae]MCL1077104.1 TrbC/VirB2 family protein [Parashewanella spongiae]RJY17663.1 type IV secretion protein [Parashewanella spongiae]
MKGFFVPNTIQITTPAIQPYRAVMAQLWLLFFLFLVPEIAFANPITEGVNWVMDLLTNGIARSAAVIGIAILGYLAWFGRITGETCGKYIAGIVLVFGGTTIVDMIISAVK